MNLFDILTRFPDQQSCIAHLERIRFGDEPYCPLCGGMDVARKKDRNRVGRWNCHDCKSSFNVLSKTIMQQTQVPLQKWFCAIALIVNAKKSLSSCQLARDLDLTQQTAWYMQQRIRAAMASKQLPLLKGIIEADETYVGGRPRRRRNRKNNDNQKTREGEERKRRLSWARSSDLETSRPALPKTPPDEASSTSLPELSILKVRSSFQTNIKPMTSFEGSCLIPSSTTA